MSKIDVLRSLLTKATGETPLIYEGEQAFNIMRHYVSELDEQGKCILANYDLGRSLDSIPDIEYSLMGFFNYKDANYYATILSKGCEIDPSGFLFVSEFIPFRPDVWLTHGEPNLLKIFTDEFTRAYDEAYDEGKKPVVITGIYEDDTVSACSLSDKKVLKLTGYRTYRKDFELFNGDSPVLNSSEAYHVYIPSEEFRILTGIEAPIQKLSQRHASDLWEERDEYVPDELVPFFIKEKGVSKRTFYKALGYLNKSFREDMGKPEVYAQLESRIKRFERLLLMQAPKVILKKEEKLIRQSIRIIETK